MLLDTGSGCASPLSIDGVAFGVGAWSTSRVSTVQVGQTVLDRYTYRLYPFLSSDAVKFEAYLSFSQEVFGPFYDFPVEPQLS